MKSYSLKFVILFIAMSLISSCARDLNSNVYTSDATLSMTLEGKILATRPILIKNSDKLQDNTMGMLGGGAMGGIAGSGVGKGSGQTAAVVGGAILGAVAGSFIESKLGENNGFEYIVKVDGSKIRDDYFQGSHSMRSALIAARNSGILTIVQGNDVVLQQGQKVYIIVSEKRTRIVAAS